MKRILILLSLLILLPLFAVICQAQSNTQSELADIKNDLFSILSDDVENALQKMGLDDKNFDSIYNVSLSNITSYFSSSLKDTIINSVSKCFALLSVVIIIGLFMLLFKGSGFDLFEQISAIIVCLMMISIVKDCLGSVITVLELSSGFMISYIPIYTLIISLSGNVATAFTYNSLVLFFAESVSSFISFIMIDIMGMYFCLSIAFSMNAAINTERFISMVNRAVTFVLGFSSSVFASFLSIKSVLSTSIDSVSVRSARFLISSFIPVVGSSISEAYSSLLGSINLIKGSVAIVGILAVLIINLPVIAETLVYYLIFNLLSEITNGLGSKIVSNTFKCFACGIKIMLLLCSFQMFILIISTGIMLSFKGVS